MHKVGGFSLENRKKHQTTSITKKMTPEIKENLWKTCETHAIKLSLTRFEKKNEKKISKTKKTKEKTDHRNSKGPKGRPAT